MFERLFAWLYVFFKGVYVHPDKRLHGYTMTKKGKRHIFRKNYWDTRQN